MQFGQSSISCCTSDRSNACTFENWIELPYCYGHLFTQLERRHHENWLIGTTNLLSQASFFVLHTDQISVTRRHHWQIGLIDWLTLSQENTDWCLYFSPLCASAFLPYASLNALSYLIEKPLLDVILKFKLLLLRIIYRCLDMSEEALCYSLQCALTEWLQKKYLYFLLGLTVISSNLTS